jgi:Zn-dependent protease
MRFALPGGKITVTLSPSFWLMIGVYGWAASDGAPRRAVVWAVVIGLSVLWHELGHAATNAAFGRASDITLHGFGGETRPRGGKPLKTWQRFLVSADGCAAGLALAAAAVGAAALLARHPVPGLRAQVFLPPLLWANLYLSLLNLLPIAPLDGGHLAVLVLESRFGRAGTMAAHALGAVCAAAAAGLFYLYGQPFMAVIGVLLAAGEARTFRQARVYNPQDEDESLRREFEAAQEAWERGEREEAVRLLSALRDKLGPGYLRSAASRQLAGFHMARLRPLEAYPLLREVPEDELSPSQRRLLQSLAHRSGDFEEAIRLGQTTFQREMDAATAGGLAASYAALGDARLAVQWLKTAARLGLAKGALDLRGPDFDKIRDDRAFRELEAERRF